MSDYIIGRNPVMEYLDSNEGIEKLFLQKGELKGSIIKIVAKAKNRSIPIQEVNKSRLDELSEGGNHQGVALLANEYNYYDLGQLLEEANKAGENPLLIILDEITDPHNLGAIIRTAEAAGADGIIIPKRRSALVNSTVHKTSAGATSHMKVAKVTNISQTIDKLKESGYWVYGADGDKLSVKYTDIDYQGPVALVIGNEGKGISKMIKKSCDHLIKIPMYGNTESLNASTSAAILIYEVVRSRNA